VINGVKIVPLRQIADERGKVMHMIRCDAPYFTAFGEVYFSMVYPGVVKAWHLHKVMTLNYAVPIGLIKFVLYDDRADSSTRGEVQEVFLGPDSYQLVVVPPGIWNGFKGIGTKASLVANCSSTPHDPEEIVRQDPLDGSIPYDWGVRHG
jgi:dTDP-4-dehydrorhamnose 3,5-epimerase